jgi:hypothetical protein
MVGELDKSIENFIHEYDGTEIERIAKIYFNDKATGLNSEITWDDLNPIAKLTWYSFAERRMIRDS